MKELFNSKQHPVTRGIRGALVAGTVVGIEYTDFASGLLNSPPARVGAFFTLYYGSRVLTDHAQDQVLKTHGKHIIKREIKRPAEIPTDEEVITSEQDKWAKLNINIGDITLPTSITPEVRKKLHSLSMDLIYIPKLDYEERRRLSIPWFSEEKRFENTYYQRLRLPDEPTYTDLNGKDAPLNILFNEGLLSGTQKTSWNDSEWVALEGFQTAPQTNFLTHAMGLHTRKNIPWSEVTKRIKKLENPLLSALQLKGKAEVRLPDMNEWNLFAGQHKFLLDYAKGTDIREWTSSIKTQSGEGVDKITPLVCGNQDINRYDTYNLSNYASPTPITFRLAIAFKS